jgi:hypothetical protein
MCILLAFVLNACFEETNLVTSIAIPTGKGFYPVSGNTFVDLLNGGTIGTNRQYAKQANIRFELQYWSETPVTEINLYQTISGVREKVMTTAYPSAFSSLKSCDTLLINYTLPSTAATTVKLEVEILNENTLSLIRALSVKTP